MGPRKELVSTQDAALCDGDKLGRSIVVCCPAYLEPWRSGGASLARSGHRYYLHLMCTASNARREWPCWSGAECVVCTGSQDSFRDESRSRATGAG